MANVKVGLRAVRDDVLVARDTLEARPPADENLLETMSGRLGGFVIDTPTPGLWELELQPRESSPPLKRRLLLFESRDLGEVVVPQSRAVTLAVVDAEGRPLRARFAFAPTDSLNSPRRSAGLPTLSIEGWAAGPRFQQTNDEGMARVLIDGRSWTLDLTAPDHIDQRIVLGPRVSSRTVRMQEGIEQDLDVLSSDGKSLSGVLIYRAGGLVPLEKTNARGRARITRSPSTPTTLSLLTPTGLSLDHILNTTTPKQPGDAKSDTFPIARVVLASPGHRHVRITTSETGAPISDARVFDVFNPGRSLLDHSGDAFSIPACSPASFAVLAPGRSFYSLSLDSCFQQPIDLAIPRERQLAGRVVDSEGFPVAGSRADLSMERLDKILLHRGLDARRSLTTTENGLFSFSHLPPNQKISLLVTADGFTPSQAAFDGLPESRNDLLIVLRAALRGSGRVLSLDEQPIVGAKVQVRPAGMPAHLVEAPSETWSNERGEFSVSGLEVGDVDLHVSARGFAPATIRGITIDPGEASSEGLIDLGAVLLGPGVSIEGIVLDTEGQPIADVELGLFEHQDATTSFRRDLYENPIYSATSQTNGRFVIPDLRADEPYQLRARREGYLESNAGLISAPASNIEMVLRPTIRIVGTVTDRDGEPVKGVTVIGRNREGGTNGLSALLAPRPRAHTDREGHFELSGLAGGSVDITVTSADYQRLELFGIQVPAGETFEIDLVLEEGATLRGTVRSSRGRPLADSWVDVKDPSAPRSFGARTRTDAAGQFELRTLLPGHYALIATTPGGRKTSKNIQVKEGEQTIDLTYPPGVEIRGYVLDTSRQPIAGAILDLVEATSGIGSYREKIRSGGDGSFLFAEIGWGTYHFSAAKAGFAPKTRQLDVGEAPIEDLKLILEEGSALVGEVLGLDNAVLHQVEIRVLGLNRQGPMIHPDYSGRYRIEHLPYGEVMVEAQIPATGRTVRDTVQLPEGAVEVHHDLLFGRGYTLTGSVSYGGAPARQGLLFFTALEGSSSGQVPLDGEGRFRIENLRKGRYRLEIIDQESGARHNEEIEITGDDHRRIEIEGAGLAGWARDSSGQGLANVAIYLQRLWGEGSPAPEQRGSSDSRGYFDLGQVEAGSWRLIALSSSHEPYETRIYVEAGQSIDDIELLLRRTDP